MRYYRATSDFGWQVGELDLETTRAEPSEGSEPTQKGSVECAD